MATRKRNLRKFKVTLVWHFLPKPGMVPKHKPFEIILHASDENEALNLVQGMMSEEAKADVAQWWAARETTWSKKIQVFDTKK